MENILISLVLFAIAGGVVYYLTKRGKIADRDGDGIPNIVEDTTSKVVEEVVEVKRQAKQKARQVKSAAKSNVKKATTKRAQKPRKATPKSTAKGGSSKTKRNSNPSKK